MKKYFLLASLFVFQVPCFATQPTQPFDTTQEIAALKKLSIPELEHLVQELIIEKKSSQADLNIGPILSLGLVAAGLLLLYQVAPVNGNILDSLNVIDWVRCAETMTEECFENFLGDTICETLCEINDFCWAFIKDDSFTEKICAITAEVLENS
ncbi:hypothetical protein K2W90_00155 [Candidatus Babeliales bacterium]|nr:hypothetical protein [Candidatus Babeliales bacterium]